MNKITGAIIVAAIAVTLSGCSGTVPIPFVQPASASQSYIASVHRAAPSLQNVEDKTLLDSGHGVCSALNDGHSADELLNRAIAGGLDVDQANAIIDSAITAFCPAEVRVRNV